MIKLTRVDHRLLHGQVAFSWTKFLDANCILIASDSLMNDELKMNAMRMAKPTGVKLVMKNIEDSIQAIKSGVTDKYNLFIIVEAIEDVYRLAQACSSIREINLGGMKAREDRHQIAKAVFISSHDEILLQELCDKGIDVFTQLVPGDSKQNIVELLK